MDMNSSGIILLIDDDALVSETLTAILRKAGYTVVTAVDGGEGLKKMQTQDFNLVITDIIMPEKDGIETIREIRRTYPSQQIVAISGGSVDVNLDFLEFAEKLGANGILHKPIDRQKLLDAVAPLMP